MDDILAGAKRVAEEAEVFMFSSEEESVQFEANRLKQIQSKQSSSVALRVIKQGRVGYAISTGLNGNRTLINDAVESAQFGMLARFDFPSSSIYPNVEVFDPGVEAVSIEEVIRLGEELIAIIVRHTPDIMCEVGVTKSTVVVSIINSRGGQVNYKKSVFSLGIQGTLIRGTDMLFIGDSESSCHPLLGSNRVANTILRQLELARNQVSVSSQSLPVIFTPHGVASALIPTLMAAFNGKTVLEGASPIGDRLRHQVFDEKLCLCDDPTLIYRPGSHPCDDEGVPAQRTYLIERGSVTHFFYDLQTAALANTQSTGNGDRSGGSLGPSPTAFIIAPGHTTFAEMVGDMKEGLIVEWLMGAGQGNILGGDFSGNVLLGYKVKNGKIAGRVKDAMISGNAYQVLKHITAIGSETEWVGGFLNTPHLYCPNLSLTAKR